MQTNATTAGWQADAAFQALALSPEQTAFLDRAGKIVYVNDAWLAFAAENGGDPHRTAVGENYVDACRAAGDDADDALRAVTAVLQGRDALRTLEYPCHAPDQRRWFRLRCVRIDADPVVAAVIHDDLTDHYLANEARRRLDAEAAKVRTLERTEESTTTALNTIGHALRTPLTPVRLQMATLQRADLPDKAAALVAKMRASTELLVATVNEAVRAIEVQQAPIKKQHLKAEEAARQLQRALHDDGALTNVSWHVHAGRDVDIDLPLLAPPLAELLRMAKARDPEGHAELDVDLHERAVITVRHHVGQEPIPADDAPVDTDPGLGLAIYMCRAVARMHGGHLKQSETKGTVSFRLELPPDIGGPAD